jgi:hypothetical protein
MQNIYEKATVIKYVPKIAKKKKEWMTGELLEKIKLRDLLFRKLKKDPSNPHHKSNYQSQRNRVVTAIRNQKKNFYMNRVSAIANDPRKIWSIVNEITGRKSTISTDRNLKGFKGISDDELGKMFLKQFTVEIEKIKVNCTKKILCTSDSVMQSSIYVPEITASEVRQLLASIKNKSPGVEGIRMTDIKNHEIFNDILAKLINLTLEKGKVPYKMKTAIVSPIYKDGSHRDPNNYRPISILPSMHKVMEKYIANKLIKFMEKHDIISKYQYGFQQSKGTKFALEKLSETVKNAMERRMSVVLLFVDLKKAFDTVDHKILLSKLYNIGIRGAIYEWFSSYLKERSIRIKIRYNYVSEPAFISTGVPQGSILGPLLFLIYINDLFNVIKYCTLLLYADDALLISNHMNFEEAKIKLEKDFKNLLCWTHDNNLVVNEKKSKVMHVVPKSSGKKILKIAKHTHTCLHVNLMNCKCPLIEQVTTYKYLGVIIDDSFKFKNHLIAVNSRLRRIVYQMYYLKSLLPFSVLKLIYCGLVESLLRYGITIWGNANSMYYRSLIKKQNKLIKALYGKIDKKDISKEDMYKSVGVLRLDKLYRFIIIQDNYFCNTYKKIRPIQNSERFRTCRKYMVPLKNTKLGNDTFGVLVPKIFNKIPEELERLSTKREVKIRIKEWLENE